MGKTVEEAAYELHFSSSKYFATLFRRITGVTPSEFKLRDSQPLTDKSAGGFADGTSGQVSDRQADELRFGLSRGRLPAVIHY